MCLQVLEFWIIHIIFWQIRIASLHNSEMLEKWRPSITCVNYDVDALGKEASRIPAG